MSRQVLSKDTLIIGDSNIRRYLYRSGGAYSQTCQCGLARNLTEFGETLSLLDSDNFRVVIFAMMTNIVIDAGSSGHDQSSRLELIGECTNPLLENIRDICESRPDKEFYLVPTTPRNKPYWYTDAQPAITRLLQLQLKEIQPRLIPLPGFPSDPSSMDTDGVHFTALAGIAYCQHVIDSARSISAAAGSEPPDQFVHIIKAVSLVSENQAQLGHVVRALQDKDKMRDCEEQEEKEGRMNCDLLDRFIVIGGPFFEPGDDLQAKLQEQVRKYLRLVRNDLPTEFVHIRQYRGKKAIYDVEMPSVSDSRAIRDAFGQFWRKKSGKHLPDGLKGITIANCTTFPTRVRVRLLKELARKHTLANPELSCFVTNYYPRPELKIRNKRAPMVTMTYSEAVVRLSHHLTAEFLVELYGYAKTALSEEEIVKRFLILTPDLLKPGAEQADTSNMSIEEQQPPEVQEQSTSASSAAPPPAKPTQGTSATYSAVTKKNNRDRFFTKPGPYSKKN